MNQQTWPPDEPLDAAGDDEGGTIAVALLADFNVNGDSCNNPFS